MKRMLLILLFSFTIYAQPPVNNLSDIVVCGYDSNGYANFNLDYAAAEVVDNVKNNTNYTYAFYESETDALAGINAIAYTSSYINTVPFRQTLYFAVTNKNDDTRTITPAQLIINPAPKLPETQQHIAVVDSSDTNGNDGWTEIDLLSAEKQILGNNLPAENFIIAYYTSEEDARHDKNPISMPNAYNTSSTIVYFRLSNFETECFSVGEIKITILPADYETPLPKGQEKQVYTEGQTLTDLVIDGENINWYTSETAGEPLDKTTLLTEGTTYYASQTMYGIESRERLPVTVYKTLSASANTLSGLTYFPNPVTTTLLLNNNLTLSNVSILNTLGQQVFSKAINNTIANIDFSVFKSGVYFVKITAENGSKTLKIIKE